MSLLLRLAVLACIIAAAAPGARAQSVALANKNALTAYGMTFTISKCNATCDGDSLQLVSSDRNTIMLEVVNTAAPHTSAVLSATTKSASLAFDLTIAPGTSQAVVTGATLIATGYMGFTGCSDCTGTVAQASAAFSGGTTAPTLTDNLAVQGSGVATKTLQTVTSVANVFSPASANFSVSENLSLNGNGNSGTIKLSFNSVALRLTTAPEPASLPLLLVALGGLLLARRRLVGRPRTPPGSDLGIS